MQLIITFPFNPIPALRMTQKQVKLLRIPDHKLDKTKLALKLRVKRYLDYKTTVLLFAKSKRIKYPNDFHRAIFFIETKDKVRWGNPHLPVPDGDNLFKAITDALLANDSAVWDYRVTKFWCEPSKGRTELWA